MNYSLLINSFAIICILVFFIIYILKDRKRLKIKEEIALKDFEYEIANFNFRIELENFVTTETTDEEIKKFVRKYHFNDEKFYNDFFVKKGKKRLTRKDLIKKVKK